jgi:hypothetical protein
MVRVHEKISYHKNSSELFIMTKIKTWNVLIN